MRLRYYADARDEQEHEEILNRLRRVHHQHGIPIEVERVDPRHDSVEPYPGDVREADLNSVYDRDFSYNQTLSKTVGRSPADAFKTNSGHEMIRGIVGVVDDGLQWATRFGGSSNESDELDPDKYTIDFLDEVLERGQEALAERTRETNSRTEKDVINEFVRESVVEGEVNREVEVGNSVVVEEDVLPLDLDVAENWFTRKVDLIIEGPEYDWVVEVKKEYSASEYDTVLGQVLVSDELYREDESLAEADTKRAIVFGSNESGFIENVPIPEHLVAFAQSHGIEMFVGDGDGNFRCLSESGAD